MAEYKLELDIPTTEVEETGWAICRLFTYKDPERQVPDKGETDSETLHFSDNSGGGGW